MQLNRMQSSKVAAKRPTPAPYIAPENAPLAERLEAYATLLQQQGDDRFRIRAYHDAAAEVSQMARSVPRIYATDGLAGLVALPKIGQGIAKALAEMITTGRWAQLERLRGETNAAAVFSSIPGIGPKLANQLVDQEDIETLEELERALQPGAKPMAGFGPRRRQAVLAQLSQMLSRIRPQRHTQTTPPPPVSVLLQADATYRRRAQAGELVTIAPHRFNPKGVAWLPVLHEKQGDWNLTLLFSNTALAHQLGRTHDWVVVYYHKDGQPDARCTIVTETRGALQGKRVIRGREDECEEYLADLVGNRHS
jgi:hypothetical protein